MWLGHVRIWEIIPKHQTCLEGERSYSDTAFLFIVKGADEGPLICFDITTDLYSYLANSLFDWFPSRKWLRAMAVQTNRFYKEVVFVYYIASAMLCTSLCVCFARC